MKTVERIFMVLPVVLAVLSCAKEELSVPETVADETSFDATYEEPKQDTEVSPQNVQSKATLNISDFSVSWNAGDLVSVFDQDESNFKYTASTAGYKTTLTGNIEIDETKTYYAIQPYRAENTIDLSQKKIRTVVPTVQLQREDNFSAHISVSESVGKTLKFYNVCGLIGFQVTQPDIVSVTITSNGPECLTGEIDVDVTKITIPTYEVVDGIREVTLATSSGTTFAQNKTYYVAVLPQQYTSGVTFTMFRGDGTVACRTQTKGFLLERSKRIFPLGLDVDQTWVKNYYISNAAELQGFLLAAHNYRADETVYLDADIDLKGYELVPATSFSGTFCGKNPENNETVHKLMNWTARDPLFKTVNAGAVVRDVIIDESSRIIVNAAAKYGQSGAVANVCRGLLANITNNADAEMGLFHGGTRGLICGLLEGHNAKMTDCVNNGDLVYNGNTSQGSVLTFGMLVGAADAKLSTVDDNIEASSSGEDNSSDSVIILERCKNYGRVNIELGNDLSHSLYITGVVGALRNRGGAQDCENRGAVLVSAPNATNHFHVSGITFYAGAPMVNCDNHGDVTCLVESAPGKADGRVRGIGVTGVACYMGFSSNEVSGCDNYGNITFRGGYSAGFRPCGSIYYYGVNVGGVFGAARSCDIISCINGGSVSSKLGRMEATEYNGATYTADVNSKRIQEAVTANNIDYGENESTHQTEIVSNPDRDNGFSPNIFQAVGGVVASSWDDVVNCTNRGTVSAVWTTSTGAVFDVSTVSGIDGKSGIKAMVGGVVGGVYHARWSPLNEKNNPWYREVCRAMSNYTGCTNEGNLNVTYDIIGSNTTCYAGGVVGFPSCETYTGINIGIQNDGTSGDYYFMSKEITDCKNSGYITCDSKGNVALGGVSGGSGNHRRSVNTGTVYLKNGSSNSNVGGISGYMRCHEALVGGRAAGAVRSDVAFKNTDHVGANHVGGVGGAIGGAANTPLYIVGLEVCCTVQVPVIASGDRAGYMPWAVGLVVGVADQNKVKGTNGASATGVTFVGGMSGGSVQVGQDKKITITGSPITFTGGSRIVGSTKTAVSISNFMTLAFPWNGTTQADGLYGPNISYYLKNGSTIAQY